jgi:AAHS family 4-hydroxybenzoate transporter-like MFS transporter
VAADRSSSLDVGEALDTGRWSGYQKLVTALVALAVVLDGFDNQALGFALPAIIRDWGVDRAAFAPVIAAGIAGMAIGAALGGVIGDRFGRRPTLIGSMLLFAVATGGFALADSLPEVGVLRLLAGIGIGGAQPTAAVLTAELTPRRYRALAVTLVIVCIPVGGTVGGLLAAQLLPLLGRRSLFVVGAVAPVVLAALLLWLLPESPRFLVRHAGRHGELARLLARCGHRVSTGTLFVDAGEQKSAARAGLRALLGDFYRRDTAGLWMAFFFAQMAIYLAFSWMPTMLAANGLDLAGASSGLTAYNFGGIAGAIGAAILITRFGSRWILALLAGGGVLSALMLPFIPISMSDSQLPLIGLLGAHGLFVNAVQTMLYALAAHVYLTEIRTTGTGAALGVGRIGAILSSFIGTAVIAIGPGAYYQALAIAVGGCLLGLMVVRNHIPGLAARS